MKSKAKKGMIGAAAALLVAAVAWMIFKNRNSSTGSASINNKEGRYSDTFKSRNAPRNESADISAS